MGVGVLDIADCYNLVDIACDLAEKNGIHSVADIVYFLGSEWQFGSGVIFGSASVCHIV